MAKANIYILSIKRKGKSGDRVTLHQRIYLNGEQWQTSLGISLPANEYNAEKELCVCGADKDRVNRILQTSKQIINDILLRYELIERKTPTIEELTNEYTETMVSQGLLKQKWKKTQEEINDYVIDVIDEFILKEGHVKGWTEQMKKKFRSIIRNFKDIESINGNRYRVSCLTSDDLDEFSDYMIDTKGVLNTTLTKKIRYIRWFLRWCFRQGIYQGNLFDKYKPKFRGGNYEQHNVIFLNSEELNNVENHQFAKGEEHLERVRDYFIFACYCGMRYSDVEQLRPEHIQDDAIQFVTKKTNDRLTIDLNKHTRAMLEKYKDWAKASGKCFPVISNQKTNKFLHELLKICEIDTPTSQIYFQGETRKEVWLPKYDMITFHAARRTFITQALRLGIPTPVIMAFSGHKSTVMLKPYMKVVDELKKKEMAKFDSM